MNDRFSSCRWKSTAGTFCRHHEVQPVAGESGFNPESWCPQCTFYKKKVVRTKRTAASGKMGAPSSNTGYAGLGVSQSISIRYPEGLKIECDPDPRGSVHGPSTAGARIARLDKLLAFKPILEAPGFSWGEERKHLKHGVLPESLWRYGDTAHAFIKATYEAGWCIKFKWAAWQEEGRRFIKSPELLESASEETLEKLLTMHVRLDRFCEGHLGVMWSSGQLAAILRRMEVIRDGLR